MTVVLSSRCFLSNKEKLWLTCKGMCVNLVFVVLVILIYNEFLEFPNGKRLYS